MIIHTNLKIAEEWGIDKAYALECRKRYLTQRLWEITEEIDSAIAEIWESEWDVALFIFSMRGLESEKAAIKKELAVINKIPLKIEGDVDDAMIERARSTPIETVIEFKRGMARCLSPKHEDKNPSMYHGRRTNHAICGGCGEKFDSIAAYMAIWGTDFITAVKRLQ